MQDSRVLAVTLALSLLALGLTVPVAGADARLTLTDTTVSPGTPTAGAPITAETTLRLSGGSDTPITLDNVTVVDSDGNKLGRATDLGRLSPGETLSVPVTFTVDEPDVYDLRLVARGTDSDDEGVRSTRPLSIGVERGAPLVEVRNATLVAGTDNRVEATVSNPTTGPLRNVEVRVTEPERGEQTRRTVATLAAGASTTLAFDVRAGDPGDRELTIGSTYTDPTGAVSTARYSRSVTVEPLIEDVGVRARPTATTDETDQVAGGLAGLVGGGGGSALQQQSDEAERDPAFVDVTVTNFGNAPVDRVVLTARSADGALLGQVGRLTVTDRLEPGDSATVQTDLSDVRGVDGVRFVATYRLADRSGESAVAYNYSARRGNATITGTDVSLDEDGQLRLDGNLANTGTGEIRSAVVRVVPDDRVTPAYPQRTYFVGTVASSEFAPFELTAQADVANASTVTVEVTYMTDGEQIRRTATLPVPEPDADSDSGSSATALAAGSAVVVLLAVTVIVLVRRRRR
ncbi:hypothetical protein [Haloarcula montana]|uniref:hypothetical protein n=1 Tax=Haloarcula montana TaxID=3111776 RepID=UPI002D778054|nr:hypothetical protein [Haloarcula sp. GH36]